MASILALGPCAAAVLAKLQAAADVTALITADRISDDAPPRPVYPYILVEGSGEVPLNTMGPPAALKYGSFARVQVRVVSQTPGETEVAAVINAIKAELDSQPLTVSGYASADITFEALIPLKDTINGIVTREWIAEFEVTVSQS